jgi:uncharacterized membrane protein HdeD (DUF308 family)
MFTFVIINSLNIYSMEKAFESMVKRAGNTIKNWWLLLIAGVLLFAMGIVVFCTPGESYISLGIFFGIAILCFGIASLAIAISSQNYFMTRSYNVIGGIIDTLLGIFLCLFPGVSIAILPLVLGCWLLYHSFMLMGLGSDLSVFHVKGWGWPIFAGLLLLVLSIMILIKPFQIGAPVVVLLTGSAFIIAGIIACVIAFRFRTVHLFFKEKEKEKGKRS